MDCPNAPDNSGLAVRYFLFIICSQTESYTHLWIIVIDSQSCLLHPKDLHYFITSVIDHFNGNSTLAPVLSNGRDVSLLRVAQPSGSISAFSVVFSAL